jgi:hypothetical protein
MMQNTERNPCSGNVKKQKLVVLGMVEDSSGNILIAQRSDPKIPKAHLKWDLPGDAYLSYK